MPLIDWIFAFTYTYFFIKALIALEKDDKQTVKHSLISLFFFALLPTFGVYVAELFFGSDNDL